MRSEINVHKAQSTLRQNDHVDDGSINITLEQPLNFGPEYMNNDAMQIATYLRDHLPGGTFDRLLTRLMEIKTTQFHVAHGPTIEGYMGRLVDFNCDWRGKNGEDRVVPNNGRGILTFYGKSGKESGNPPYDRFIIQWDAATKQWGVWDTWQE
jgi:hypothetical protein